MFGERYGSVRESLISLLRVSEVESRPADKASNDAWVLKAQDALREETGQATQIITDPQLLATGAFHAKSQEANGAMLWLIIKADSGDQDAFEVLLARDIMANPRRYDSEDISAHATVSDEFKKNVKEKVPEFSGDLDGDAVGSLRAMGVPDRNIMHSSAIKIDAFKAAAELFARMGAKEVREMLGYDTFVDLGDAVAYGKTR